MALPTTNPDVLGEYSKLYYIDGSTDLSASDAIVLGLSWVYICPVDVSITRARTLREVVDRCVGEEKVYSGGKRDTSVTINMNELRYDSSSIAAWQAISDTPSVISVLILNGDIADVNAWGMVGNYLIEQDDDSQPSEGNNTNTLTFKPAAASTSTIKVRRIYGSAVTPAS